MRVFRFMSNEEFEKYINGETLINNTNHKNNKFRTSSDGFCFFNEEAIDIKEAIHFLSGIVNFDVCAVFETDISTLHKGYGIYAKPLKSTGNFAIDLYNVLTNRETIKRTEYSTKQYNKKTFKLIKFSKNVWKQYRPIIDEQIDLNWEAYSE